MLPLTVLLEDNHCLAVLKPAGVPTMIDVSGDESLHAIACEYLREKYAKPGRVFLGVVHRLDRPVSGVVLFARTRKAAARLSEQFRTGRVRKVYRALLEGRIEPPQGELHDWLLKDEVRNHVRRVPAGTAGAKECRLRYRVLEVRDGRSLVEVEPKTGRSHQIRVQLAARSPIVGDVRYGSEIELGRSLCLHAAELTFEHPVRREPVTVVSPLPDWA
jgi:23S rRNA pseudouridine1911/1915/1917 synthase